MSTPLHRGSCLCGAIRYEVHGPLRHFCASKGDYYVIPEEGYRHEQWR